jgi:glutamyl-tRNA reductase
VELARKILGELQERSILLIGAGKMGELAAKNLIRCGISEVFVTNRTPEKAVEMAAKFNGTPIPFEQLHAQLVHTDIAIVSTGAREYVLAKQEMQKVGRERRYRPLFLIDISVPRNVEPAVNDIEEIFLYDIDDMKSVIEANIEDRKKEAEAADQIIEEEVEQYTRRAASRNSGALIGALRQRIEAICLEELQKNRNSLEPADYERLERMLQTTAHRLAHPFIMQIKHPETNLERHYQDVELIKRLFELDDME